ncbi:uncharacterized protein LOC131648665 [Vicia villosa]|uniref:uncharacterized protein LOC131648665 n=1 Tax=Vicia villosa TaxID=3911 RepID=UPI00273B1408|nr:uncharacterized protein LOC131648665 [Vicia villosa]
MDGPRGNAKVERAGFHLVTLKEESVFLQAFKSVGSYGLFHDGCFNNLLLRSVFFYSTRKKKGADPSLTEFYFRTHRKKDQSWVGVHAESTYDKFEQKKLEISSQNPTIPGEDGADSQPTNEMPPDLDIWVESVGKKKRNRVFGLGTASKTLVSVSKKPSSDHTNEDGVDETDEEDLSNEF